ncbi:uncharacterized protein VP01_5281g2 [Puccinia sorghi]|uniref:Uncharacterized protein n=1 Tax=Puccinia sorghi TaxID=27349 RepID=A0A0L6UKC7_9BASI|nr:uncharacterized protein VP01_5281g2 [Puccinia sorghi]
MQSQWASWQLSQVMQEEGFPSFIGFVDGTTITHSQKTPIDGNHYYDPKKSQHQGPPLPSLKDISTCL